MSVRVSFIVEWANTTYNGVPRFFGFLNIVKQQWQALVERQFPSDLKEDACHFLNGLDPEAEFWIVSGEPINSTLIGEIRNCCAPVFMPEIHVSEGLEYYALKNRGAELANGDILCFVDSDIHPDEGWMAHLLGSFAKPYIKAVAGQPYVAPIDLFSRAFALGWRFIFGYLVKWGEGAYHLGTFDGPGFPGSGKG